MMIDALPTLVIEELAKAMVGNLFGGERRRQKAQEIRENQLILLRTLTEAGIDPHLFDLMLSSELDRNLKKQFGVAFLVATVFFTLLSYGVIVFNAIDKWGITDIAITALIVETPIQFIGLLYIIARNLFPQASALSKEGRPNMAIHNALSAAQSRPQPQQEPDTQARPLGRRVSRSQAQKTEPASAGASEV